MTEKYFNNEIKKDPTLLSIDELEISVRLYIALKNSNIKTLGQIVEKEENFFTPINIPGLTAIGKREIDTILKEKNLTYKNSAI